MNGSLLKMAEAVQDDVFRSSASDADQAGVRSVWESCDAAHGRMASKGEAVPDIDGLFAQRYFPDDNRNPTMSFYEDLLKLSSGRTFRTVALCEVQTERVDLDEDQFAGFVMDDIFDEFRKTSKWPEQNLKFSELEKPLHHKLKPSEVLTSTKDGGRGARAVFICGKKQVEVLVTLRELDRARFELKFGPETVVFSLAETPFCPPFSPGIVISILGARLVMGVLQDRFGDPPRSTDDLSDL